MSNEALAAPALPYEARESLGRSVMASIAAHVGLLAVMLTYGLLHFGRGPGWGNPWEKGSSARVQAVASLPGVPLPSPLRVTPNTVANENPGLYQTEVLPLPLPELGEQIPKFKDAVKPEKQERINKRIQKQELTPPPNAVPYGEGGHPAVSYNQFTTARGDAGISFGEGNFGELYGYYVDAIRSRISGNWLQSTISPNVMSAPRVFVSFDILRDGTITDIRLTQSSGNVEVDRSALRAIEASNPLGSLPPGYSGSKVSVNFYFDFRR